MDLDPVMKARASWSIVYPVGVLLLQLQLGCSTDVLDGRWREPALGDSGRSTELVLAQYGPVVAGLVRFYEGAASPDGSVSDPYLKQVECTLIEEGSFDGDVLRLRYQPVEGAAANVSLNFDGADGLVGFVEAQGAAAAEDLRLARVDDDVDRACGNVSEPFNVSGFVRGSLPATGRVALAYVIQDERGDYLVPAAVVAPEPEAATFAFSLDTLPDDRQAMVAPTDASMRFAFGVFVVFDDTDGDGRWRVQGTNGASERVLGVDPSVGLAYLEGDGATIFPRRAGLLGPIAPGYSLVEMTWDEDAGAVERLEPAIDGGELIEIDITAAAPKLPWLDL